MAETPYPGHEPHQTDPQWSYDSGAGWGYGPRYGGSPGLRPAIPPDQGGIFEALVHGVARSAWAFGLELLALAVLVAPAAAGALGHQPVLGGLGSAALLALMVGPRPCRRWLARVFHATMVRRSWHRAVRALAQAGNQSLRGQLVAVRRVQRRPVGDVLDVRVPVGVTVTDLEKAAEALAAVLEVRALRVRRDPTNARQPRSA